MGEPSEQRYRAWQNMANHIAGTYLRDRQRGEDLLHDGMQNLARSGYALDDTLTDELVRTVLNNRALDLLREARRRPSTVAMDSVSEPRSLRAIHGELSEAQLRALMRDFLDRLRFEAGQETDYWAVFLVRVRSAVGRMWVSSRELEERSIAQLVERFADALPWHDDERARRIQRDWSILDVIWERCVGVIQRDGLLRPGPLCAALDGVVPQIPERSTWTQWESRARREAGQCVLLNDRTMLAALIELSESDGR
jgi:hypothetical protein